MLPTFRKISLAEGTSFLFLLLIAMPLKYTGWIHGLLFIAYVGLVFRMSDELVWKPKTMVIALIAGVLPFGTFYFDRKYLR